MGMAGFDVSKEWVILSPSDIPHAIRGVEELSRCIGLLAGNTGKPKPPVVSAVSGSLPPETAPVIILNSDNSGPERNGFVWRAGKERIEIFGESERGLCNGIFSFLAALGISWPAPGQEKLPSPQADNPGSFPFLNIAAVGGTASGSGAAGNEGYSVCKPSHFHGKNPTAAPWRRFVLAGNREIRAALKKSEAFAAWAGRNCYDAVIFPLAVFGSAKSGKKLMQLKQFAGEYGITLEAGGWDLSSFVPRKYFLLNRDSFRMEGGRRENKHHFCPTSLGAIRIMGTEGKKLFQAAAEVDVFHLWPDKGAETMWCSCPTCRAFTPQEQNRMGVNAAADVLASVNPRAFITCYEKPGEAGKIPLKKNVFRIDEYPEEAKTIE